MEFDPSRGVTTMIRWGTQPPFVAEYWDYDGAVWSQRSPAFTASPSIWPPGSSNPAMPERGVLAFDPASGSLLMQEILGGAPSFPASTWVSSGSDWIATVATSLPSDLTSFDVELFFDPAAGVAHYVARPYTEIFTYDPSLLTDTFGPWVFPPASPVHTPPFAITQSSMAFDSQRQVVVLFGGLSSAGLSNDTWEYDGIDWVQRSPAVAPSPRYNAAMTFDSDTGVTVLVGGITDSAGTQYSDEVWEWDGVAWTQIVNTPGLGPPPIAGARATYDSQRGVVVLHGGYLQAGVPGITPSETWEFDRDGVANRLTVVAGTDITITANDATFDGLDICVEGGALTVEGSHAFRQLKVTGGSVVVSGDATFVVTEVSGGSLTVEGSHDSARLNVTGGAVFLNGASTFDVTNVNGGSLTVGEPSTFGVTEVLGGALTANASCIFGPTKLGGGTTTLDGRQGFASLTVEAGATITHSAGFTTPLRGGMQLAVEEDLILLSGARIDVSARGFVNGPGTGSVSGSYGGRGISGPAGYGSFRKPVDLGSGAAVFRGGGAVTLVVGRAFEHHGVVRADGDGLCSGGSVLVFADELRGDGVFQANGGGDGGGGRIAIYAETATWNGSAEAHGGGVPRAGAGTVLIDLGVGDPELRIAAGGGVVASATELDFDTFGGSVHVLDGAVVSATRSTPLALQLDGDLVVDATSTISLDGRGFGAGSGPGGGTVFSPGSPISAGGYGGDGGNAPASLGGASYGSIEFPVDLGSGGAVAGGGAFSVQCRNAIVDGVIRCNGSSPVNPFFGAGGSGGSILIEAETLAGSGFLQANGGAGLRVLNLTSPGGGGGRIAIHAQSSSFSGVLQAYGGDGDGSQVSIPLHGRDGGAGSIYQNIGGVQSLRYDNDGSIGGIGSTVDGTLTLTGDLVLANGAGLSPAFGVPMHVICDDLTIDTSSFIDASGRGFPQGVGPGEGVAGGANGDSGGGYGGRGGRLPGAVPGGMVYGSAVMPVMLGSPGGSSFGFDFGRGGGAVRVTASGTITLNGAIRCNGTEGDATSPSDGGGSGGSVFLTAATMTGTGSIAANGSDTTGNNGGGGGGGRVALSATTQLFPLANISVDPGASGSGWDPALPGTISPTVPLTLTNGAGDGGCNRIGGDPELSLIVDPDNPGDFTFVVSNTDAPTMILLVGLSDERWGEIELPFNLWQLGAPTCSLRVSPDVVFHVGSPENVSFALPAGLEVSTHYQALLIGDPNAPVSASNALTLE